MHTISEGFMTYYNRGLQSPRQWSVTIDLLTVSAEWGIHIINMRTFEGDKRKSMGLRLLVLFTHCSINRIWYFPIYSTDSSVICLWLLKTTMTWSPRCFVHVKKLRGSRGPAVLGVGEVFLEAWACIEPRWGSRNRDSIPIHPCDDECTFTDTDFIPFWL